MKNKNLNNIKYEDLEKTLKEVLYFLNEIQNDKKEKTLNLVKDRLSEMGFYD